MKSSMLGVYMLLLSASPQIAAAQEIVPANAVFNITWAVCSGNPVGYEVYKTDDKVIDGTEEWQLAGEVTTNTFTDTLPDLTAVYFRVRGFKLFEDEKIFGPYSDNSDRIIAVEQLGKPGVISVHIP